MAVRRTPPGTAVGAQETTILKRLHIAVLVMLLLTAACGRVSVNRDENYTYVTVTLTEQEVSALIVQLITQTESGLLQTASADFRAGEIVVTGTAVQNGQTVDGSLTIVMSSDGNGLQVRVTSFNFAGFSADQARLDAFNATLAAGISARADSNSIEAVVSEVNITDTSLALTIRTPRRN